MHADRNTNQWPGPFGLGPDGSISSKLDQLILACSNTEEDDVGRPAATAAKSPGNTLPASTAVPLRLQLIMKRARKK
ncbi:unnamed protein product [Cuscuta campestris]|uniref:Uncharacterized protein n=1 Tax=Cuscuta campestris TaxID=132261 RepID=A0A484L8E4_9ASTE|nr:unnamed protein product [Cuscuta campestris]